MEISKKDTQVVYDEASFKEKFFYNEDLSKWMVELPSFKVQEIMVFLDFMVKGIKIETKPTAFTSQDAKFQYIPVKIKGPGGEIEFFIPYHKLLQDLIFDYICGKIKIGSDISSL